MLNYLFVLIMEHSVLRSPEAGAVSEISLFAKHDVSDGYRIDVVPSPTEMHTASKQSAASIQQSI